MKTKFIILTLLLGLAVGLIKAQTLKVKSVSPDSSKKTLSDIKKVDNDTTELIKKLKALIKDEKGRHKIGTFKIERYAVVFPPSFPIKYQKEMADIRHSIDTLVQGKSFKKGKREYEFEFENPIMSSGTKKGGGFQSSSARLKIAEIDSVKIDIKEGLIELLKIYSKDEETFYNTAAPIPILTMEKRFEDKLYNPKDGCFILLKDVLSFDADTRFNYFPDDTVFIMQKDPNKAAEIFPLSASNDFSSFVNIQAYSDLLGVLGDKANGLVQIEANTKFYLHRGNVRNKFMYAFYAFEPFFHFSKIDSKFDTISLSSPREINRMEVFRRHTFAVGTDLNVFRFDWRPANSFELKAGYQYSVSNLVFNAKKVDAILHTPYAEAVIKSKRMKNFGTDLRVRFLLQKLNPIEGVDNLSWDHLWAFKASVYYFSGNKNKDKVFLRFLNYVDLGNRKQDFSQLQLGFSKALSF